MGRTLQYGVNHPPNRFAAPQAAARRARTLEASGSVDWLQTWDQLVNFIPQALWREDTTPLARYATDCDSFYDAAMVAMLAADAAPSLNITTTLDAVRNGPAELLQKMTTLASATPARVALQLGAGEAKQCTSFGYRRSQGLSRMEDIYRIVRKLLDTDGLISHEGNHWTYDRAWIGGHFPSRPEIWALGGGPRLVDLATSYADGFVSMVPSAYPDADSWGRQVDHLRGVLEGKDRDPDDFEFGFWPFVLVYETEDQRERLFASPIVKWMTAVFGRLRHGDWENEGIDLIFPADWMYAVQLQPHRMSRAEVDEVADAVPPAMIEKSWLIGTPSEVAAQLRPWVEAGATYIAPSDLAPAVLEAEEQAGADRRLVELGAELKRLCAVAV